MFRSSTVPFTAHEQLSFLFFFFFFFKAFVLRFSWQKRLPKLPTTNNISTFSEINMNLMIAIKAKLLQKSGMRKVKTDNKYTFLVDAYLGNPQGLRISYGNHLVIWKKEKPINLITF